MSFARILVPVDFSAHAQVAARIGALLARREGAELTLLHVDTMPELALLSAEPFYIAPQAWDLIKRNQAGRIEHKLGELAAELRAELGQGPAIKILQHTAGDVVGGILASAGELASDLLVIGSHGATATHRLLFGSVAAKVSRAAHCPVLVVRPGRAEETIGQGGLRNALVAVDYSRFSLPAAHAAARLLEPGGTVEFLHVWQEPPLFAVERSLEHDQQEYMAAIERARAYEVQRMRGFVANCKLDGFETAGWVEVGSPAHQILDQATELGAEVIVVGAHGRHGVVEKVIGTVADRVLRSAEIPVLLIPAGALPES